MTARVHSSLRGSSEPLLSGSERNHTRGIANTRPIVGSVRPVPSVPAAHETPGTVAVGQPPAATVPRFHIAAAFIDDHWSVVDRDTGRVARRRGGRRPHVYAAIDTAREVCEQLNRRDARDRRKAAR